MKSSIIIKYIGISFVMIFGFWGCKTPEIVLKETNIALPGQFQQADTDSTTIACINWQEYFGDLYLNALIDTVLKNNQELNIVLQEIEVSKSEVLERKGEYLPFVDIGGGLGTEKAGRYTRNGAVEHNLEIKPNKEFPDPLSDFNLRITASWEIDIWRKLRNARDAAEMRYLAQSEGKNFLITQLVAETAETYYELMALDNLLKIINQNLEIQAEALEKMRQLKEYAKANQLAVNRFEAQLLNTKNQQYAIRQKIVEKENRLSVLTGAYPKAMKRNSSQMMALSLDRLESGIPVQLLQNRPDIRQAELNLAAANLDVKVAKANFYPRLGLKAGLGFQAFNPAFLFNPESLIFNAAGDLIAPLINKKAIQARYNMAGARQIQAAYTYEQTLLNAYTDVLNQLAKLENFSNSFTTKAKEVDVLNKAVEIANSLFQYAKADYVEVLLTQEEVLDAQMELVEAKFNQLQAKVQIYRALGGGWR